MKEPSAEIAPESSFERMIKQLTEATTEQLPGFMLGQTMQAINKSKQE